MVQTLVYRHRTMPNRSTGRDRALQAPVKFFPSLPPALANRPLSEAENPGFKRFPAPTDSYTCGWAYQYHSPTPISKLNGLV